MKHKKKTILLVTDSLDFGGIETYVVNLCKFLDKKKFTVLVCLIDQRRKRQAGSVTSSGCEVLSLPDGGKIKKTIAFIKILSQRHVDLVHFHVRHSYLLFASKLLGKKNILHAHFAPNPDQENSKSLKDKILKLFIKVSCNKLVSCSDMAGSFAFYGLPFSVVKNIVDSEKFKFSSEARKYLRRQYRIGSRDKVIVQAGRFNFNKNQLFTLEVLKRIKEINPDFKLVLLGDGEDRGAIEKAIKQLRLASSVVLAGNVEDAESYYSAADLLIHPSIYEGFSYAVAEAHFCNLVSLSSCSLPQEVRIFETADFLPLSAGAGEWSAKVIEIIRSVRSLSRESIPKAHGYDPQGSVRAIEKIYLETLRGART